jgi:hypothetical protein
MEIYGYVIFGTGRHTGFIISNRTESIPRSVFAVAVLYHRHTEQSSHRERGSSDQRQFTVPEHLLDLSRYKISGAFL